MNYSVIAEARSVRDNIAGDINGIHGIMGGQEVGGFAVSTGHGTSLANGAAAVAGRAAAVCQLAGAVAVAGRIADNAGIIGGRVGTGGSRSNTAIIPNLTRVAAIINSTGFRAVAGSAISVAIAAAFFVIKVNAVILIVAGGVAGTRSRVAAAGAGGSGRLNNK